MHRLRIVQFLVYDGPIWRFSDQIVPADRLETTVLKKPGDTAVLISNDGMLVYLATEDYDDFPAALTASRRDWLTSAVKAIKDDFRRQTPTGVLRLYRDPIDGTLRNLAE